MSMIHDSLVGYIVGDCLGVPIKSTKREQLFKKPVVNMIGNGNFEVDKGVWSDDTSLTLATMDSIVKCKRLNYDSLALKFCDWINKGKYTSTGYVFDIGITTRFSLMKFWSMKKNALICGNSESIADDNNSLTRMMPIAFFLNSHDYLNILTEVNDVSSITHSNSVVRLGCYLYVNYMIKLINEMKTNKKINIIKKNCFTYLKQLDLDSYFSGETISKYSRILDGSLLKSDINSIRSNSYIVNTLESVLWIINNTNSFEEALIGAINLGGCTDTIGALTGSIAGILYGYDNIPERWINDIKKLNYAEKICNKFEALL